MGRQWPGVKPRTIQVELPGSDPWATTTTNQADPHNPPHGVGDMLVQGTRGRVTVQGTRGRVTVQGT